MTEETAHPIVRSSFPVRQFHDLGEVAAVAVFPDRRRMATSSSDGMVRIWDLKTGDMLMELEGRGAAMRDMALSRDGKLIASSDDEGYVIVWHGDTGKQLIQAFKSSPNSYTTSPLDFSLDGTTIATGSYCATTLWNTETWELKDTFIHNNHFATCVRYSPSGKHLAIATDDRSNDIFIWDPVTKECIARLKTASPVALVWTPDGTRLLSGCMSYTVIREWDSSTWTQITSNNIWKGHTEHPWRFSMNCDGTVVAFPTTNNRVRLMRLSDRRTIAIFQSSDSPHCIAFAMDGKHILVGSKDGNILEWAVPEHGWSDTTSNDRATYQVQDYDAKAQDSDTEDQGSDSDAQYLGSKILVMNTPVRNSCINGDLTTAEDLLTREIDANGDNYHAYASRSVVMARKLLWDRALDDATKSLRIRASLMGYISKGVALCGNKRVRDARNAFDLASTFIDGDPKIYHSLFLIKSIALFSANLHTEAMKRLRELAATCPTADTILACRTIEVYLHIQLGNNALDRANATEAAEHFTAAVNASTFLSKPAIHSKYEEFAVLFGCDFTSLWQTANQKRCHALLRAGKIAEVFDACRYMAEMSDESMKASCLNWTIGFMQEMNTFRGNAPNADATPEITMCQHEDDNDEKDSVSISDIDSDIESVI